MMSDNLEIWEKVQTTPGEAAKAFDNGNFKGTSANATFNAKRATELFGPYGLGWWVEIEMEELVNLGTPEKPSWVHTLRIGLHYKLDEKEGVARGFGSTAASYQTKGGWQKVDDDYAKKSMTDAISKALQFLGFSADIWMGLWDDNKYVQARRDEFKEAKQNGDADKRRNGGGHQSKYVKDQPKNESTPPANDGPPPGFDDAPPCGAVDMPDHDPATGEVVDDDGSMTVILQHLHKVGVANLTEASQEIAAVLKQEDVGWFECDQILGANDEIIRKMPKAWRDGLTQLSAAKHERDTAEGQRLSGVA